MTTNSRLWRRKRADVPTFFRIRCQCHAEVHAILRQGRRACEGFQERLQGASKRPFVGMSDCAAGEKKHFLPLVKKVASKVSMFLTDYLPLSKVPHMELFAIWVFTNLSAVEFQHEARNVCEQEILLRRPFAGLGIVVQPPVAAGKWCV